MDIKAQVLAWHGWAFDRTCWNPWERLFTDQFSVSLWDRGYWGSPKKVEQEDNANKRILLTHSFGLHLCPNRQLKKADVIVIFGGFREFHPIAAQFRRRSKLILNKMIKSMQEDPEKVLKEFIDNAFEPAEAPQIDFVNFDIAKLLHDLHALNKSTLNIEPLQQAQKICILHGSSDGIVPKTKGRELYNIFRDKASYFEVKNAGHALPFTHMEQCWAFIQPELRQVLQRS